MPSLPDTRHRRSIHLHPSRFCNLRCKHCYSDSGPDQRDAIDDALIQPLLADAWEEGFGYLSISGGEPLLWSSLFPTLQLARDAGFATALTTNATLIEADTAERLRQLVHLVGVSVDGPEEEHIVMRGSPSAWRRMQEGVGHLAHAGVVFGIVFTLTEFNCHHIERLIDFADQQGAAFLQIHPLEPAGNALSLTGATPGAGELLAAAWNVARLHHAAASRGVAIKMDVIDVPALADDPARVNAVPFESIAVERLADLLDALVVEPDGEVVPLSYGFDRRFAIGNLSEERLSALCRRWQVRTMPAYLELCTDTLRRVVKSGEPIVNWSAVLRQAASRWRGLPNGLVSAAPSVTLA